ncbi:Hypothetical predicted protein [Mytilus galloprovincialis]|uniref:C1q domain-containing protein n=1 Tax=Mytilus galloprovincialis TaxID=29158 RepID=A0A8B6BEQ2_MYTGA|nr:Hypothetical predicted protein [Mytilus galloprovincialis]
MADMYFPAYAVLLLTIIHSFSILLIQADKENGGFVLNQMITDVLDKQRIHEAPILLQKKNPVNQAYHIAELQELQKVTKDKDDQKAEIEELRTLIKVQSNCKTELVKMWKVIEDQAIEIGKLKNMQNFILKDYDNEITNIKAETDINQNLKNSQLIQHEHISNNISKQEKKLAGKKIITNEGNGYNVNTGSFTCPESGMYLLFFSIGERGDTIPRGAYIYLMVNSVNVIDAVVDSYHNTQDLQGGNTVIIRLKAGDVVFTEVDVGVIVKGQQDYASLRSPVFFYTLKKCFTLSNKKYVYPSMMGFFHYVFEC